MVALYLSIEGPQVTDGESPSAVLVYKVAGTTDEPTARALVVAAAPLTYGTTPIVYRQSVDVDPIGYDVWSVTVNYGELDPDESQFTFDTTGATAHITQGKKNIIRLPGVANVVAPDFGGLINVEKDDVKGTDVVIPSYKFSETHKLNPALVSQGYKITLRDLTGTINVAGFRGFAAGEVLFLGASGSLTTSEKFTITYSFVVVKNWDKVKVGPFTVTKKGHEFFWVSYYQKVDAAAKHLVTQPLAGYVEKVYDEAPFGGIGIGN